MQPDFYNFVYVYVTRGMQCLMPHNSQDSCGFSLLAIIGYVGSVCAF